MAITLPSLTDVVNKARTGIKNALPNSNPFLKNSFLDAIARMAGGRVYDFYYNLNKNVLPELFLTTARNTSSIEELVVPFSITRTAATQAVGTLIATGTLSTVIPIDTTFQDSVGNIFVSQADATIANLSVSVSSLSQVGGIATAVSTGHGFFTGLSVTVSGANESDYNGTFSVIVSDEDTFTYTVDVSTTTPATGTIIGSALKADVAVESEGFGADLNLLGGESVTVTTPITGIDDDLFVQFPSLSGGTDIESDESLREAGLDRYRNPSGNFTTGDIERAVKEDLDNTRVFVQDITPAVGQVTVYFVQDNAGTGAAIIPGTTALDTARTNVEAIAPAPFDQTNDLFVLAPTPITVNYVFTSITPSTTEMQTAINNSLTVFFQDSVDLGQDITELEYNAAIINTVDETGTKLTAFTLSNPVGDITIADGELGILGSVSFS
ncbi:baseplate J/gp47 family protein [Candidatus Pacearchaeota archaeon]|nr:baseplate J/gp47 family protein [Candidatus Pacearchaeota archaeon]